MSRHHGSPRTRGVLRCATLLAWLMCADLALAHAPPEISRVVWNPAGDRVALMTNRGIIFGEPNAQRWLMLCGTALGLADAEEVDIAYLADGRLLAATRQGLQFTSDRGCRWQSIAAFANTPVTALTQHPNQPNTLYAGVSSQGHTGIYITQDAGQSWLQTAMLPDGTTITKIASAPGMPNRVYATANLGQATGNPHALLRSSDTAKTWEQIALPLHPDESRALVLAVSPTAPDTLLLVAYNGQSGVNPDRLLLTRDGGRTFTELLARSALRDASFDPDGKRAFIAGADGFWKTDDNLGQVTASDVAQLMSCVGTHTGMLYACGHHSGFDPVSAGIGTSADGGETFQRWMTFVEVNQPVTCQAPSTTTQTCSTLWTDWQLEILVSLGGAPISILDAGPEPAAGSSSPEPTPAATKSGGCGVTGRAATQRATLHMWILLVLVAARSLRRRLRRCDKSSH